MKVEMMKHSVQKKTVIQLIACSPGEEPQSSSLKTTPVSHGSFHVAAEGSLKALHYPSFKIHHRNVLVACAKGLSCNGCVRKIPAVPSRTDSSCSKWYKLLFVPFAALEGRVWAAQHCSQGGFSFLCFLIRVCIDGLTSSWMKSGSNIEIMEITCRTVVCSRSPLGASARAVRLSEKAY